MNKKVILNIPSEWTRKDHQEWMSKLQVGDYLIDCRYYVLKISKIQECWKPKVNSTIMDIIYHDRIPIVIGDFIYDMYFNLCLKLGFKELSDKDLVLEDGSHCSAMNCCSPVHFFSKYQEE